MKELKLRNFISANIDWQDKLKEKPFCLNIKEEEGFYMFSYNQLESVKSNDIVKESRGIILDSINEWLPVCYAFNRFYNYGETHSEDLSKSKYLNFFEKVDGSIIKIWYDRNNKWRISTNNSINAYTTPLKEGLSVNGEESPKTFGDLVLRSIKIPHHYFFDTLNKNHTTIFEVVSPFNKVVIEYKECELYYLGERDNVTYEEFYFKDKADALGCKTPKKYTFLNLKDCVDKASTLPFNEEGFVVCDENFKRVKIKSTSYINAHHLKNNGIISRKRAFNLILDGEMSEFITYYPEYEEAFLNLKIEIDELLKEISKYELIIRNKMKNNESRKDIAEYINTKVKRRIVRNYCFSVLSNKKLDVYEYIRKDEIN